MKKKSFLIVIFILICFEIFEIKSTIATEATNYEENACIVYQAHVENVGWQNNKKNGELAGTTGESLRVEALKIYFENKADDVNVEYQVHVQNIGWQDWKRNGELAGTTGKSLRVEAIKIKVDNTEKYDIQYQVHIQDIGWQDWKSNGEIAGTTGQSMRIEAIRIRLVKKQYTGKIEVEIPSEEQNIFSGKDINVVGWKAADTSNTKVNAYIDDLKIDDNKITYSSRADLLNKVKMYGTEKDNSQPCFEFQISTTNLTLGNHKIKTELVTTDGTVLSTATKNVNVIDSKNMNVLYVSNIEKYGWLQYTGSGNTSGIEGGNLKMEAIKIECNNLDGAIAKYQVYMSNTGWQKWKNNGEIAGVADNGQQIEAIRVILENACDYNICYRVFVKNIGWQDWKYDGEIAGSETKGLPIEAIQIKVTSEAKVGNLCIDTLSEGQKIYGKNDINICGWKMSNAYNSYIQAYVDDNKIDQNAINYVSRDDVIKAIKGYGTVEQNKYPGFNFCIDSTKYSNGNHKLTIKLVSQSGKIICKSEINFCIVEDENIHVIYNSHMQKYGWLQYVADGNQSGKSGEALRLEGVKINLLNAPVDARIKYRAHVQNIGWQDWKYDNELAGTEGKSYRVEAIQVNLENLDEYTVEYKVHIQDIGWSQWYIDGEVAGTIGQSKRIEAIIIRLVPKYKRRYVGIDVSVYNGKVDWTAVKNSGIDFAFIRLGYRGYGAAGNFAEDSRFKENIQGAKNAGLKVGIYFVTQAVNEEEAIQEANWVLERIKPYQIDYPIAMDVEFSSESNHNGRADRISKSTRTVVVKRFCERIQSAGYTPMVYLNVDWAKNYVDMSQLTNYDTWIAHYKNDPDLKPSYNGAYTIWQYTATGSVYGVNGNVDCNICYRKY